MKSAACSFAAFVALTNAGTAGCFDQYGIIGHADAEFIEICFSGTCEIAALDRTCGNIHYSSFEYDTPSAHWLFRVRYHDDRPDDDEYFIFVDDEPLSSGETDELTCRKIDESSDCEAFEGFVGQFLQHR